MKKKVKNIWIIENIVLSLQQQNGKGTTLHGVGGQNRTFFKYFNYHEKTWVLYDSEDYLTREDYEEMSRENEVEPTENGYWEWVSESLQENYDELQRQIERVFPYEECVIIGSLGLWHGRVDIEAIKMRSVWEAIQKSCGSADHIIIKQVNGHFEIEAYHHDGSNYFEIYLLNDKGVFTEKGDLSNRRYHKAIKKCLWNL